MLKEKYERSALDIIIFTTPDVIETSGDPYESWNPQKTGGYGDEYEGWLTR